MVAESPEDDASATPRLHSLTGLRFYAAFAVLLRHAAPKIVPLPLVGAVVSVGPVGVGFFFVLSGFVLTWGYQPGVSVGHFWRRRVARIYPLHLATTILAVCAAFLLSENPQWASALFSLTLLQSWLPQDMRSGGNVVSWSLSCEAFFYLLFPFIIVFLRRLPVRQCLLGIVLSLAGMLFYIALFRIASVHIGGRVVDSFHPYANPAYRTGEFVIGILLARLMQQGFRLRIPLPIALFIAVAAFAVITGLNITLIETGQIFGQMPGLPLFVLDYLFLPITIFLIAAAATNDLDQRPSPVGGAAHVALGQWSFALYLIQMLVILPIANILPISLATAIRFVILGLTLLAAVSLSWIAFVFFEQPLERRFRGAAPKGHAILVEVQ